MHASDYTGFFYRIRKKCIIYLEQANRDMQSRKKTKDQIRQERRSRHRYDYREERLLEQRRSEYEMERSKNQHRFH